MNIPELGVGIIYFSGFEQVIESNSDLIQTIEIEPQTFWYRKGAELDSFIFNEGEIDYLKSIDKPKIFHGVGYPIGGSAPTVDKTHIPYMQKMIDQLRPTWLSEHLSFNNVVINGTIENTNFLLPPLQTLEGIDVAAKNINNYAANFKLPFAIETGTNYLAPLDFEFEDGYFVNSIVEKSDAHILLDIHNLLANQKNGRQKISDFINQLDLDRVLQIHLANGFYFDDYYLDAHSDVASKEVMTIFEEIVKKLPHLKAVTFEMLPEYLNNVPASSIRNQLEKMNAIWDMRGTKTIYKNVEKSNSTKKKSTGPMVSDWENTLGALVIGKEATNYALAEILQKDKGVDVIIKLIEKFRKSALVGSIKLTCRYLMLSYGIDGFESILRTYWKQSLSQLYASENGLQFAEYLLQQADITTHDQILYDLVLYEYNSLLTLIDGKEREVEISFHPYEIISFLANGELPKNLTLGNFIVTIEPSETVDNEPLKSVFHS